MRCLYSFWDLFLVMRISSGIVFYHLVSSANIILCLDMFLGMAIAREMNLRSPIFYQYPSKEFGLFRPWFVPRWRFLHSAVKKIIFLFKKIPDWKLENEVEEVAHSVQFKRKTWSCTVLWKKLYFIQEILGQKTHQFYYNGLWICLWNIWN